MLLSRHHAEKCLHRAEVLEMQAAKERDPGIQKMFLDLAEGYRKLAEQAFQGTSD
jgi:hypothetical protein